MNRDTAPAALRAQISGSSFYAGMRILPLAERNAMYAVYGFCRLVDDIADDGSRPPALRADALELWRRDIDRLYDGGDPGQAHFLVGPIQQFSLDRDDFHAVIDGMAMDVAADICCPSMAMLDLYCDRVASAVGRLSVRIFGMEQAPGIALAHHLGRALQLTNILRDIDEDAVIGRVYLPAEALMAAGIEPGNIAALIADPRLDIAARHVAEIAQDHYAQAGAILARRPKGHLIAPKMMAAVYARTLRRSVAQGWRPPRRRIKTSKPALILTLLRLWLLR